MFFSLVLHSLWDFVLRICLLWLFLFSLIWLMYWDKWVHSINSFMYLRLTLVPPPHSLIPCSVNSCLYPDLLLLLSIIECINLSRKPSFCY